MWCVCSVVWQGELRIVLRAQMQGAGAARDLVLAEPRQRRWRAGRRRVSGGAGELLGSMRADSSPCWRLRKPRGSQGVRGQRQRGAGHHAAQARVRGDGDA